MTTPDQPAAPWWRSLRGRLIAVLIIAVTVVLGLVWHARQLPADAVYRLDGTVVSTTHLRHEATAMRALYGVELPEDPAQRATFWKDLAKSDALARVLAERAAERKITVSRADGEQALTTFVTQAYGPGSDGEKAFADALVTAGTSRAAVVREVQRQLLTVKLYDAVTGGIEAATETETRKAFDRWSCHFGTPEKRQLKNIVVLDEGTAKKVRRDLDAGGSFDAAVAAYSKDEATVAKAGNLGLHSRDELEAAYGKAAFGAARGADFGPVKTEGGWNVGLVVRVVPRVGSAYGEVKSMVALADLNQRKSRAWRSWITAQLRDAQVEYADRYRPAKPYAAPEQAHQPGEEQLDACTPDGAAQ
jgi:peptidyl-prolyl cis-trans isomerase C